MLAEHNQCFGQTATDMLLGEIHNPGVGAAEVAAQLMDEKPRHLHILIYKLLDYLHRYGAEHRCLHGLSRGYVWLTGKIGTIAEILHRTNQTQYLLTTANAVLAQLGLAFEQTPQILRVLTLGIYDLVFFENYNQNCNPFSCSISVEFLKCIF